MKQYDEIANNELIPTLEDLKTMMKITTALPAPSADNVGESYILNGVQEGYSRSHAYHCELKDGRYMWVDLNIGTYGVGNVTDLTLYTMTKEGNTYAYIKYKSPEDLVVNETTLAKWTQEIIVRKRGSEPTSSTDGTVIEVVTERNKYANSAMKTLVPQDGLTYFYKIFPVSTDNVITNNNINCRNTESNYYLTHDSTPMAGKSYYVVGTQESNKTFELANLGGSFVGANKTQLATRRYDATTGEYVYTQVGSAESFDPSKVYYLNISSHWYVVDYSRTNIGESASYPVSNYISIPKFSTDKFPNYYEFRTATISWKSIKEITQAGAIKDYFQVGDIITLPWHGNYGYMQFEVAGFNQIQIKGDEDGAAYSPSMTLQAKNLYLSQNFKGAVANSSTCVFDPVELAAVESPDTVINAEAPYFVRVVKNDAYIYAEASIGVYNVSEDGSDGKRAWLEPGQAIPSDEQFFMCDLPWKNPGANEAIGNTNDSAKAIPFFGEGIENAHWAGATGSLEMTGSDAGTWSAMYREEAFNGTPRSGSGANGDTNRVYFKSAASLGVATTGSYTEQDYKFNPYLRYFSNGNLDIGHSVAQTKTTGYDCNNSINSNHYKKWYLSDITARMMDAYRRYKAANNGGEPSTLADICHLVPVPTHHNTIKSTSNYHVCIGNDPTTGWPVTVEIYKKGSVVNNAYEVSGSTTVSGKPAKMPTADLVEYKNRSYFTAEDDTANASNQYGKKFRALATSNSASDYRQVLNHCAAKANVQYYTQSGSTFAKASLSTGDNLMTKLHKIGIQAMVRNTSNQSSNQTAKINAVGATTFEAGNNCRTVNFIFNDPIYGTSHTSANVNLWQDRGASASPRYVSNNIPISNGVSALKIPSVTSISGSTVTGLTWSDKSVLAEIRQAFGYLYTLEAVTSTAGANPKQNGWFYCDTNGNFDNLTAATETSVTTGRTYYRAVLVNEASPNYFEKSSPDNIQQVGTTDKYDLVFNGSKGFFYATSPYFMRTLGTEIWQNVTAGSVIPRTSITSKSKTEIKENNAVPFFFSRVDALNNGTDYLSKIRFAETMPDLTGFETVTTQTMVYQDASIFFHVPNLERVSYGNNSWADSYVRKYLNGPMTPSIAVPGGHCAQNGHGDAIGYSAQLSGSEVDVDWSVGAPLRWCNPSHPWDTTPGATAANSKDSLQSFLRGFLDVKYKPVNIHSKDVEWNTGSNAYNSCKYVGDKEKTFYWYDYASDSYIPQTRTNGQTLRLAHTGANAWMTAATNWVLAGYNANFKVAYELNENYEEDILEAYYFLEALGMMVIRNNMYGTTSYDYYNENKHGSICYDKVTLPSCYQMNAGNQSTNGVIEDTAVLSKWVGCTNADRIKCVACNSMYDGATYVAASGSFWWLRTAGFLGAVSSNTNNYMLDVTIFRNLGQIERSEPFVMHVQGLSPLITIA